MNLLKTTLRHYRKESILAPLLKMLEALLDLFVPIVMVRIIDIGIAGADRNYILGGCGVLVLLGAFGLLISVIAQFFAAKAAVGVSADIRHQLFAHITELGYGELDAFGSGTLLTRMTGDINQMQNAVNLALRLLLRSPFIVLGAVVMAFTVSPRASLVFVAALPLLALVVFGIMRITRPLYRNIQTRLDRVTGLAGEQIGGMRVVRAFGRGADELTLFQNADKDLYERQLMTGRLSALMNPLTLVIVNLAIVAILEKGAVMIDAGALTQGAVIALVNYMSQILVELVKLANLIVQISRGLASADRVEALLQTETAMRYPKEDPSSTESDTAVLFRNVSFSYPKGAGKALQDLDFEIRKGETCGIIGGTGSGKTTVVNLICRHYDAEEGTVMLDGANVRAYTKAGLRERIGLVPQKARLFSGTVRSNLLFGKEDASDKELWEALRTACADEFVRAKDGGLDAAVEEGGRNFSGGQRQRLCIARALVKKPALLILDDSASALDYATDALLRSNIRAFARDMTVVIVSQRINSIMNADRILVLDDGRAAGYAPHAELLEQSEVYRDLYESQYGGADHHA